MISREKCIDLVFDAGMDWHRGFLLGDEENRFVALINRAYAEGQKDANPCKECKAIGAAVTVVRDAERDAAKASVGY